MALHHNIKPHHHVTIWLASFMILVGSVLAYNSVLINGIQAQGGEPSESTKKFFGFDDNDGAGRQFVEPEACRVNPNEDAMNALQAQMQSLQDQMAALYPSGPPPGELTPEEQAAYETQQTANQASLAVLQSQMDALQTQMSDLQAIMQQGPSDDCKKAIVTQSISEMERMLAEMSGGDKLNGTLDKVDSVIAKIEVQVPALEEDGISAADIAKIQTSINTIKANNALLRSFFASMLSGMADYIKTAKADPLSAFESMQSGGGFVSDKDSTAAANAADGMVVAFTDLVTLLDNITASEGAQ